jgi:hypothetical protein
MSASTRTVQRTLGTSQLGGMIVLLAVLAAIVGAIAFSTIGAKPADVAPAAGYQDPIFSDHGPLDKPAVGTNPEPVPGYWRPDETGKWIFVPFNGPSTGQTDMSGGLMFQPPAGDPVKGGRNDERLRAR